MVQVSVMLELGNRIRLALFGLARSEADFATRRFAATSDAARIRLESIGRAFIDGYNGVLSGSLGSVVEHGEVELQGFAMEGAGMASALLDYVTPWRRDRWSRLLAARPGHIYMIHVGAGWAAARLRRSLLRAIARRDPLLGWLVADGWGFHQTYFHPDHWASGRERFPTSDGYVSRAVDQGIGRGLWFVAGADPVRVAGQIERFAPERRADLWSGVGLAATYSGGCSIEDLRTLVTLAGPARAALCQGAAFAATARAVAGNTTALVGHAARALSGRSSTELWELASAHQPPAPHTVLGEDYEIWRTRLREALAVSEAA
jgi:hypothetical protein